MKEGGREGNQVVVSVDGSAKVKMVGGCEVCFWIVGMTGWLR